MALSWPTSMAKNWWTAKVDWVADTVKLMLMTNTYTFSAAHDFRDDITNEVSGTNYSAGGLTIDNKTASAANPCVLSADDEVVAQSAGGFSNARKYFFTKIRGGASSADELIAYGAAGADFGNVAGQLTLDIPTSLMSLTLS